MTKTKWNKEASAHTMKLVAGSVGRGVQYIREILRGDRTAGLELADKTAMAIRKHCPFNTKINPLTLMSKEDQAIIRKWKK